MAFYFTIDTMQFMKKVIVIALSFLILIVITCVAVFFSSSIILEKMLSNELKTNVTVEKVSFPYPSLLVQKLIVKNIPSGKDPNALTIQKIDINAPYINYFHHVIYIDKIAITDVVLTVEFFGFANSENNWSFINNNMDTNEDPNTSYAEIKEFVIKNLKVRVIKNGQVEETVIPEIRLKNVKTKNGALINSITHEIIYQMIFNIKNIIQIPLKLQNYVPSVPGLPFP